MFHICDTAGGANILPKERINWPFDVQTIYHIEFSTSLNMNMSQMNLKMNVLVQLNFQWCVAVR